ncbi:hypothetical protein, partial [Actinacidiphila soli]|uniref:hypothetical protein n=1 Tax=Actinacidiphila soli TaxID=2487275 RepID=UPI000FCBEC96
MVSTVLAVTAHHLASGHPVPWGAALFAAVALFAAAAPVTRVLHSLPVVAAATVAAQAGLHLWLGRATGHSVHEAHEAHHAAMPMAPMDPPSLHEAWHAGDHSGWVMTAQHLVAALLVACCLQRADAATRAVARTAVAAGRQLRSSLAALLARLPRGGRRLPAGAQHAR